MLSPPHERLTAPPAIRKKFRREYSLFIMPPIVMPSNYARVDGRRLRCRGLRRIAYHQAGDFSGAMWLANRCCHPAQTVGCCLAFWHATPDAVNRLMSSLAPTRIRWILVVCITFMAAIFFVDRVNVSIAGHSICPGLSPHRRAARQDLQRVFIWAMDFFRFPAGWLVDRLGPRRTLALGPCGGRHSPPLRPAFPPASRRPS